MKIGLNIIRFFLTFFLTLCVIVFIIASIMSSTILKKEFVLQILDETNYYANIYNAVENDFENYIYQSGLDEEVIKNIVSSEKIEKDTKIIINNIYDGTNEMVDITEIETNLKKNIDESLDYKLSATEQKMVDEFIKKITEQYRETITNTNYEQSINDVLIKGNKIIEKVKQYSLIGSVLFILSILLLNCKKIIKGFMYIMSSIISSGAFFIVVNIVIQLKVKIQQITILNDAISISLREFLTTIVNKIANTGNIMVIVGVLGLIIFAVISSYSQEKVKIEEKAE